MARKKNYMNQIYTLLKIYGWNSANIFMEGSHKKISDEFRIRASWNLWATWRIDTLPVRLKYIVSIVKVKVRVIVTACDLYLDAIVKIIFDLHCCRLCTIFWKTKHNLVTGNDVPSVGYFTRFFVYNNSSCITRLFQSTTSECKLFIDAKITRGTFIRLSVGTKNTSC